MQLRARRWWRAAAVGCAVGVAACFGDPIAPHAFRTASFAFSPVFSSSAGIVAFDHARILLYRGSGELALDTVVAFPASADSIALTLPVPIQDASGTETFSMHLALIAGTDTVFKGGPSPVTATIGVFSTSASVPLHYTGVGANAAAVVIAVKDTSVFFSDSVTLTAVALDSGKNVIANTPIGWRSLDTTLARVPALASGKVVAQVKRGIAPIVAETPTGVSDTGRVTVQPVATTLAVESGNGQVAVANTQLPQPLVVKVGAADGLGVRGVAVRFGVVSGNGKVSDTLVATDTAGLARTLWTLGTVAQTDTVQATVVGKAIAEVRFMSAVAAGAARTLTFGVQPAATTAGVPISPAVQVVAKDTFGNVATSFTDSVAVALTPGTGTAKANLRGIGKVPAAAGVATFGSLSIDSAGTGYTLTAASAALPSVASAAFAIIPAPAVALIFTTQPPLTAAYQAPFNVTLTAKDSLGNAATGFNGAVTVGVGTNPAGGTLLGTVTRTASSGVATFTGVSVDNIGSGYTLSASGAGTATSNAFNIVAPPGWNAWINRAGGSWNVGSSWSTGSAPTATDSVAIVQSGAYTVTLDTSVAPLYVRVGAPLGAETLSVAANTLSIPTAGRFETNGILALSGAGAVAGAGTLDVAGKFTWTGGTLGGNGGTTRVVTGGTLAIAPAATLLLQSHTLELAGAGTWTGTDTLNLGAFATLRVASGGVLNVQSDPKLVAIPGAAGGQLFENQGTINRMTGTNPFVVRAPVSGNGAWNLQSGDLTLSLGSGGTLTGPTTIAAGYTLSIDSITVTFGAGSSLGGAGALALIMGTLNFSSGATGSVGSLALDRGNLYADATLTVNGPTTWNFGYISVSGPPLRLAGGSGPIFSGTANVGSAGALELAGGTFNLTGNLTLAGGGALHITGGGLILNGFAAALAGDLVTSGTGAVRMATATDSLDIAGNATFGGGLGGMNAGVIRLAGNFTQTGVANFAPTGAHHVVFYGWAASNSIAFADTITSGFRRLRIAKSAGTGVTLASKVRASFFRVDSANAVTGTTGRLVSDSIYSPSFSSAISPKAVEITDVLADSGAFSPDTTVFTGTNQIIPYTLITPYAYQSVRVAQSSGTATFPIRFLTPLANLSVSQGTLGLGGNRIAVGGNFWTEDTGVLAMGAGDSLGVGGNVTFGGGSSATSLDSGLITLQGNFTQVGSGAVFAPVGTRVRFENTTTADQTIQFADPVNSFFHDLILNRPSVSTVRLLSDVQVTDSAVVTGSSVLASNNLEALKLLATGVVRVQPGGVLRVSRAEFANYVVDSDTSGPARFMPDTAVFIAPISASIRSAGYPAYGWKSVRVASGNLNSYGTTLNGNLIMSGGVFVTNNQGSSVPDSVLGFLRTEVFGTLEMTQLQSSPTLVVRDSAVFAGGSELGLLTAGTLSIGGSFVQRGANAGSFLATSGHTTTFNGSGTQTVYFTWPGSNQSTFGNLQIARLSGSVSQPAGITLLSDIYADTLTDTTSTVTDSINGNDHTVFAGALNLNAVYAPTAFVMSNARLVTNTPNLVVDGLTFRNMSPAAIQWEMNLGSATSLSPLTVLSFETAPDTTLGGRYLSATATGSLTLITYNSYPATLDPNTYSLTNVSLIWNMTPPSAPVRRVP